MRKATNYKDIIGNIYENNSGHKYTVTEELGCKNGTYYVRIEFESGFVDIKTKYQALNSIGTKDKLSPSVHGVGCLGYAVRTEENRKVFDCWRAMIARCYNPKNPSYKTYGAQGATVCDRWKRFDLFLEDIERIPGYDKDLVYSGKLDLDKDVKGKNKIYSPETCVYISRSDNVREMINRIHRKSVTTIL